MSANQVLDTVERLLRSAQHPDIVAIERYGPNQGPWGPSVQESPAKGITGVRVTHQSTATASLWLAVWPGEIPVPAPAVMPAPKLRAARIAILAAQLLDVARPPEFKAWRLVALPGIGLDEDLPSGLSFVTAAGERVLLRSSATGVTVGEEPEEEPFPAYQLPASIP